MQTLHRSFVAMLLLATALAPVACASTPPAPARAVAPGPAASGLAEGGALPACPAGAADGGACSEEGLHCMVADGPGPLQCAASGQWVTTPPCCKK
jgi:hypothetical protein